MKSFIKKILLSVCMAVFMLASIAGVAIASQLKAKAEGTEAWQTGFFEMENGVSLRLSESNGLRFIVKMDDTVYNFVKDTSEAEFGFVIAPKQLMVAANGDYLNMPKKIGGVADKNKIYEEEGFYYANGCITNVKSNNFTYDFVAVAYIKYGSEVRYTAYNDYARNNLYDTVNMAVLNGYADEVFQLETYTGSDDPTDDNTGWYGSTEYPIVLETAEEYIELQNIVDSQGIDLSNYYAIVKNEVAIGDFENTAYQPSVISEALYKVNKLIAGLPDSVTMPDAIGMIGRIRETEKLYNALSETDKAQVENYAKVENLLSAIEGYDRVYKNDADDGTVIASYVPNYTSTVGGSATTRTDELYGNVLTVTSAADGKAALHFKNFPTVAQYEKIYFYAKVDVGCNLYLSDGITNDGWGDAWKNNWSVDGFWCNENTWRLVELDVSSGYIGTDFALGFRADTTGFTFEISDFYGKLKGETATSLTFGNFVDSGTTNEYGAVYNFTQGWSHNTDMGAFNAGALRNALANGHDSLYFWIYNPNESAVDFKFTGNMNSWTPTGDHVTNLPSKTWTKVIVTPEIIEQGDSDTWFVTVTSGAGTAGWQTSSMYSFNSHSIYTDHADVKAVIALIDDIPDSITLADKAAVEAARAAYDALTATQQASVTNLSKLTDAEAYIADVTAANKVIVLIDSINARDVDEALVNEARAEYNALTATQQGYVTNIATLEAYEAEINAENELIAAATKVNTLIANLPDSVVMPDHLVFVSRIEAARDAYNALSDEGKGMVTNYAKLRTLVSAIKGYETVHIQTLDSVSVIPSHVPNYTSTIGGTASLGYDDYYGNYLKVTPNAGGKVAIQYINFPDVSKYTKIYFNIRVVGASCDIYLSDGITNDGWGDGWHNSWSISGYWTNDGNWIQKEVDVSTGIITSNWALGLRTSNTDVSFEITDIVGYALELGTTTSLTFGNFTDSGTTNAYGTVYNFTQGWPSDTDMGAFNAGALSGYAAEGDDSYRFFIYNPNESDVDMKITGNMNSWNPTGDYVTTLKAQAWTEVILTSEIVTQGDDDTWCVNVSSGAGTSGWQISPMYSFSSASEAQDNIDQVQVRINALNTETPDEYQVQLAREAYEALLENEKELVNIENLIACEETLYGDVANAPFIVDGATDYKIYIDQTDVTFNSAIKIAAAFANEQLYAATGVQLPLVSDKPETITKYRYAIVFGYEDLFQELGMTLPSENDIGDTGYAIVKQGRTVFIIAYGADGYRMGALAFLRETIGYDMIAEDCVIYDASKAAVLPEFDLTEKPSFDYRQQQTYMTEDEIYGMGLQAHTDIWIPSSEGWDMHNSLHYLPTATYQSAHPSWYYNYTDSVNVSRTQICPTAGGSSTEFNAMVEAIAANMLVQINAYPERENISFSIMDTADGDDCQCARCKLYDTLYGEGGFAAAWIDLMNAVNAKIRESLPADRVLNIAFLAYRGTEKAPANDDFTLMNRYEINDDGSYTQTSEYLKCDEGVTVWLAPINGKYAENLNHADNAETLATIKKWRALSDSVYLWMYGANFKYYMYPYNTWQASAENYKILADLGVKAAWSQSNETEATAFSDLKSYIDSKFMFNVNADYETVLDTYFTNYFGAAGATMRTMFDSIVAKCNDIEANNDGLGRGIYDELEYETGGWFWAEQNTYWSEDELNALVSYCDQAKAAIDADTTLTDEEKTVFKNRITKESLFPRYVLCTIYENTALRAAFKADATALGLTLYREADGLLSDLYSDWGV